MARLPTLLTGAQRGAQMPFQSDRAAAGLSNVGRAIGQGLQSFGDDLQRASALGARALINDQMIVNENAARDANTAARIKAAELYDAYGSLQGKNAVDAFPKFITDLEALKTSAVDGLPNDAAKRMASDTMDSWLTSYHTSGMSWRSQQQMTWSQESVQASADQGVADANFYRNQPRVVIDTVSAARDEIVQNAIETEGLSPEVAAIRGMEYAGQAYSTVIANLAAEDPLKAEALFNTVRGEMDPVSQARVAEALQPKVLSAKADNIVTALTTGAPSAEAGEAYQFFISRGYSAAQAAGIVGNLIQESGLDPAASGDSGTAYGIAQWRGDRLAALEQFAEEQGLSPNERLTQLMFVDAELRGTERGAGMKLAAATTAEEATAAFLAYERPAGWTPSGDASNAHGYANRLANAQAFGGGAVDLSSVPDQNALLARGMEMAGGDPELQRVVISRISQHINMWEARTAQARAIVTQQVKDLTVALQSGDTDVTIPEQAIRDVFPETEANRMIGELKVAQISGTIYNGIEFASPQTIQQQRADLASGTGLYENVLRDAFGTDDTAVAAGRAVVMAEFEQAVARRQKAFEADQAAFVLTEPSVAAARQVLDKEPSPAAWNAYATMTIAQQKRMGALDGEVQLLTKRESAAWVDRINSGGPKAAYDTLQGLEAQIGESWPRVFGELQQAGLPGELITLGIITDRVAGVTLTNALQAEKDKEGSVRKMLDKDVAQGIDQNISEAMSDFMATFTYAENGVDLSTQLASSVKLIAYALTPRLGATAAVQRAVQAVVGNYDVISDDGDVVARAPKGLGAHMQSVADEVRFNLSATDLLPRIDASAVYTPEEVTQITLQAARDGVWVTSPDGTGWTLITETVDGGFDPVLRADGGFVTLSYEDAAKREAPSPLSDPAQDRLLDELELPRRQGLPTGEERAFEQTGAYGGGFGAVASIVSEISSAVENATTIIEGPSSTDFPSEEDARSAVERGFGSGESYEPFIQGVGAGRVASSVDEEIRVMNAVLDADLGKMKEIVQEVAPTKLPERVVAQLAQAALATKRSALASLGFDPRVIFFGSGKKTNIAGVADEDVGIYSNMVRPSTIVHESVHRALNMMGVDLSHKAEELLVRRIMDTKFKGVERGTGSVADKQIAMSEKDAERLDALIVDLEAKAAEMIKNRRPGGPR